MELAVVKIGLYVQLHKISDNYLLLKLDLDKRISLQPIVI